MKKAGSRFFVMLFAFLLIISLVSLPAKTTLAGSSDCVLKSLTVTVGGAELPFDQKFDPAILSYTLSVDSDVSLIDISAVADDPNASISGDLGIKNLSSGENDFKITVTSQDGITAREYDLKITHALPSDCGLKSLTVTAGGTELTLDPLFDPAKFSYSASTTADSADIEAVADDMNEKVSGAIGVQSLSVGENDFAVTVTAKDGETAKEYNLKITRALPADCGLKNLTITADGTELKLDPVFDPATLSYSASTTADSVDIEAAADDTNDEISGNTGIQSLSVGENELKVTVTAQDGKTTKEYDLKITHKLSSDCDLKSLAVTSGGTELPLNRIFNPAILSYTVAINSNISLIDISAAADDQSAIIGGDIGSKSLSQGDNAFTITVTAGDGTEKDYYVIVKERAAIVPFSAGDTSTDKADAVDVAPVCTYHASSNNGSIGKIVDGQLATAWNSGKGIQSLQIYLNPYDSDVKGIYIRWSLNLVSWELDSLDSGVPVKIAEDLNPQYYTELIKIPDEYSNIKTFSLVSKDKATKFSIAELSIYINGIPGFVPDWTPYDGSPVDTMVISCHSDDEDLYMGPFVPLTIAEKKKAIIVYMNIDNAQRRIEASESAWELGCSYYPVMRPYWTYGKASTLARQFKMKGWSEKTTLDYIITAIRKYKPSVVATHDVNGEYGHILHMLTSYVTREAVIQSGDATKFPNSYALYGAWSPKKLYIHMYKTNPITLDIKTPLDVYGGLTAYEVIRNAYLRDRSQLPKRMLCVNGSQYGMEPYDMETFGLYWSTVGNDTPGKNDIFENLS